MHTSNELFDAACAIFGWFLGAPDSSTAPPDSEATTRLASVFAVDPAKHDGVERAHLEVCQNWHALSHEQQARVVDRLLVASCAQAYTGHLNPRSVTYAALTSPPVAPEAQEEELASVHSYIKLMVDVIHDNYLARRTSQEAVRAAATWRREMLDDLTVDSLHEMGIVPARLLGRMLVRIQEASEYEPKHKVARAHGQILVSPEDLIERAEAKARELAPAERRFEDYKALVHAVLGLYSMSCRANPFPLERRSKMYNFLEGSLDEWTSPAAFEDFQLLEPDREGHPVLQQGARPEQHQEHVLSLTRSAVFAICCEFRTMRKLPKAKALAHEHAAASLSHPTCAISPRYAQRYYGTTARAWQARQGRW
ncbi:hypothetical protein JCM8208_005852 [Rhodotorula glutinis]